jgi:xyloglucan-specific exo-beta-1,4-glucanase
MRNALFALGCLAALLDIADHAPAADGDLANVPYVWKNVKVGGGGFIPGIVFSPVEKGLVYARSDMGGAYRWDASAKRWLPLQDHFRESSYLGIESIAPDPRDTNVVYAAAGMYHREPAAILRSRDKGNTWETYPVDFAMGGNENGRGIGERLAIDPRSTNILFYASRYHGLRRSADYGETWQEVASFPVKGPGLPAPGARVWQNDRTAGLSFVVFHPQLQGDARQPTSTIYVGSTEPGDTHLYRSIDAGETWHAIPGQLKSDHVPVHAAFDTEGVLYVSYSYGVGPNGVTDGDVWKLDTSTDKWTDITPDKAIGRSVGGYGGLAVDQQQPGTVAVATMNRWSAGDTIWRTTDGGETWDHIRDKSHRDVAETPFLNWDQQWAPLGWWIAALAIDPFDSSHACYATGATIYATEEFDQVSSDVSTLWKPWVTGIEQTAVLGLMSPSAGPPLISAFGDISGFTHEDLAVSPPMHSNPTFGNTNLLDYAGVAPNVVLRAGTSRNGGPTLGFSEDGGRTWQPLAEPPQPPLSDQPQSRRERFRNERGGIGFTVSADGETIIATPRVAMLTSDRGQSWQPVEGLPAGVRPVADRVNPERFYALNFADGTFFNSIDGGRTFTAIRSNGLPDTEVDTPWNREAQWPLLATLGREGDLWYMGSAGLFHSTNGGEKFSRVETAPQLFGLAFGKSPAGSDYPAMYCIGTLQGLKAVWRSDDRGATWLRVNDDANQWGTRFRCIAADPRIAGRVYLGTDGRGIFYGEPVE